MQIQLYADFFIGLLTYTERKVAFKETMQFSAINIDLHNIDIYVSDIQLD